MPRMSNRMRREKLARRSRRWEIRGSSHGLSKWFHHQGMKDQVDGPVSDDLVGDVGTVVGLGVASLGILHRWSVCPTTQAIGLDPV